MNIFSQHALDRTPGAGKIPDGTVAKIVLTETRQDSICAFGVSRHCGGKVRRNSEAINGGLMAFLSGVENSTFALKPY